MATKSPNKKRKNKQFGCHQIVPCSLTWNNLVATKFPSEKKKKKNPYGGHRIQLK
jgi:hypothetical protein